jgi:hypothetical protein
MSANDPAPARGPDGKYEPPYLDEFPYTRTINSEPALSDGGPWEIEVEPMENPIDTALRQAVEAVDELIITIEREEGAGSLHQAAERARGHLLQHARLEVEPHPTMANLLGLPPWAIIAFILVVLFVAGLASFGNDSRNSDDSQQWSARAHDTR